MQKFPGRVAKSVDPDQMPRCSAFDLFYSVCSGLCPNLQGKTLQYFWNYNWKLQDILLTLSTSGEIFSKRHIEIFFLIFHRKQDYYFNGDNSNQFKWNITPCFLGGKK